MAAEQPTNLEWAKKVMEDKKVKPSNTVVYGIVGILVLAVSIAVYMSVTSKSAPADIDSDGVETRLVPPVPRY